MEENKIKMILSIDCSHVLEHNFYDIVFNYGFEFCTHEIFLSYIMKIFYSIYFFLMEISNVC